MLISLLFQESLIVSHHHLVFQLFHCIERYADSNQQRCSAEADVKTGKLSYQRWQSGDHRKENRSYKEILDITRLR